MSDKEYDFPVYSTQDGGLVKETASGNFVFIEEPDCPGFKVGDAMPPGWGIAPANDRARRLVDQEEFGSLMGIGEMLRMIAKHPDPRD